MARSRASDPESGSRSELGEVFENPTDMNERDITDAAPNVSRNTSRLRDTVGRVNLRPRWSTRSRTARSNQLSMANSDIGTGRGDRGKREDTQKKVPRAEGQWVDTGYYESNPWFGEAKKKPVFSLGRPLPHTTRWYKKKNRGDSAGAPHRSRSKEELVELGMVDSNDTASSVDVEKQDTNATDQVEGARHTVSGVGHGDKTNDVGQPVFNYLPSQQESNRSREPPRSHDDGPSYGIDSEPLGQREHDEVEEGNRDPDEVRNWWARIRAKHPEPLAEFLATTVAVFLGIAGTLSVNLSADQATQYGTYETSCWAWGFAWMFGIYLGGGVSGAHMNPAISISLSVFRGFPWRQCCIYVVVQFAASITAGALAYGIFADTIRYADPTMANTAKSLFSSPQEWVSLGTAFFNQMVGSAIMMIAVFALGDDQNNPPGAGMHALVLGLLVTTLKFTLGYNIGSALNPASDFGPRVVAYAVGYRAPEVFSSNWWLYGPWLATLAGSVVGCSVYDGFVFTGSESPINFKVPKRFQTRARKLFSFGDS